MVLTRNLNNLKDLVATPLMAEMKMHLLQRSCEMQAGAALAIHEGPTVCVAALAHWCRRVTVHAHIVLMPFTSISHSRPHLLHAQLRLLCTTCFVTS